MFISCRNIKWFRWAIVVQWSFTGKNMEQFIEYPWKYSIFMIRNYPLWFNVFFFIFWSLNHYENISYLRIQNSWKIFIHFFYFFSSIRNFYLQNFYFELTLYSIIISFFFFKNLICYYSPRTELYCCEIYLSITL